MIVHAQAVADKAIECGAGFTHNLEQMFKDIEMAREEITSYKSMFEERQTQPAFDLSVNVLSSASWPTYPSVSVNVPESILKATRNFETHYKVKHSGRRLEWKHALAHCQLKSVFPKGAKEIVVSCFQAVILIAFNNDESRSYGELKAASALGTQSLGHTPPSAMADEIQMTPNSSEPSNPSPAHAIAFSAKPPKAKMSIPAILSL